MTAAIPMPGSKWSPEEDTKLLELLLNDILEHDLVERKVRDEAFQLGVFVPQLLQLARFAGLQASVHLLPTIETLLGDPDLATQIPDGHALMLYQRLPAAVAWSPQASVCVVMTSAANAASPSSYGQDSVTDEATWTDPDESFEAGVHAALDAAYDDEAVAAVLDPRVDRVRVCRGGRFGRGR